MLKISFSKYTYFGLCLYILLGPNFENKLEWWLTTMHKFKCIKFNFYRTKPWKKLERDIYNTLIASWIQSVILKPLGYPVKN